MADDDDQADDKGKEPEGEAEAEEADDAPQEGAEEEEDGEEDEDEDEEGEDEDEDEDEEEEEDEEDEDDKASDQPKKSKKSEEKKKSNWFWYALAAVIVIEFTVYGWRGEIQVCVGKKGDTDFSLVGQERTDENRWKFPRCESRLNLGLRSNYDERLEEATKVACRGATIFKNRGEGPQCLEGKDGWERQVETSLIPPWDKRYLEHLFWFLTD